jgi:hypothetical protein
VSIPDEILSPAAPGLAGSGSGGNLTAGIYNYALSYYVGTPDVETSAVNQGSVELYVADGSDQLVTITPPTLPGGVDGYNIYRRRPGNNSFYYLTSVASGAPFVDDGSAPEDCERFAPVTSNAASTYAVALELDALPVGYNWNIYRSSTSDEWSNTYIGSVIDDTLIFTDTGLDQQYGTPPTETLVLTPGNVGLRSGAADPVSGDGNDGDWWINTTTVTLFGPKAAGSWPATGIALVGSGAFEIMDLTAEPVGVIEVDLSGVDEALGTLALFGPSGQNTFLITDPPPVRSSGKPLTLVGFSYGPSNVIEIQDGCVYGPASIVAVQANSIANAVFPLSVISNPWLASGITDLELRVTGESIELAGEAVVDPGVSMELGTLSASYRPATLKAMPVAYNIDLATPIRELGILVIETDGTVSLEVDTPIVDPAAVYLDGISYRL